MSDKPSTSSPSGPQIGAVNLNRPSDFRTLFANQSRMRIGPGEVVVTFAIADDIPNVGTVLTELVGIAMTPTYAKTMAFILTETLKLYEETFGAIPPPSATPMDPKKVDEIMKKAARFQT
ncbi:MAG: DUF3467 domain-containing protein [Pseudomonadota bacterium]|nr:DUF3467 domain-containing protein [Pseudomonadota bacterium]